MAEKPITRLESLLLLCKRHHVLAVEVDGMKVQFYPTLDPNAAVPPPQKEEEPQRQKEPSVEEVQKALHLGGGRGG